MLLVRKFSPVIAMSLFTVINPVLPFDLNSFCHSVLACSSHCADVGDSTLLIVSDGLLSLF
jgi:hypothetical protein